MRNLIQKPNIRKLSQTFQWLLEASLEKLKSQSKSKSPKESKQKTQASKRVQGRSRNKSLDPSSRLKRSKLKSIKSFRLFKKLPKEKKCRMNCQPKEASLRPKCKEKVNWPRKSFVGSTNLNNRSTKIYRLKLLKLPVLHTDTSICKRIPKMKAL